MVLVSWSQLFFFSEQELVIFVSNYQLTTVIGDQVLTQTNK